MTKYILAFIGAVVIGVAIYGAYLYPQVPVLLGSPSGSTFGTAKFAGVVAALATVGTNATTSSVFNSSVNDYYVTSLDIGCEGIGTSKGPGNLGFSALTLTVGTSSSASPAVFNPLAGSTFNGGAVTIPTSTVQFASSTAVISGTAAYVIWPSQTYMVFATNATNTAQCTFGVKYFSS